MKYKIYIYVLMYIFLAMIICYEICEKVSFEKEKKSIIHYEVLDVIFWKKVDEQEIIVFKVRIDEHEYLKTETTQNRTVIYRHSDTCSCGNKSNYGFTNQDGFDISLMEKIEKLKNKENNYKKFIFLFITFLFFVI